MANISKKNEFLDKRLLDFKGTLPHKTTASDLAANETIYFWLNVPTGIGVQDYNSTLEWSVTIE